LAKVYEDLATLTTGMTQLQLQLLHRQQIEEIKTDEIETEKYTLEKQAHKLTRISKRLSTRDNSVNTI
jgi:hypothetical protein